MTDEEKKPEPGELTGDGLGDAAGQATGSDMASGTDEVTPDAGAAAASGEEGTGSAEEDAAGTGDESADPAGDGEKDLSAELEQAKSQIAELTNRLLRTQADFENYRRRVQREKEELAVYANQKLILNLLPVLDNLERALATPPVEGDEKLRQGVELTARSFREILAKEGVEPIEAVGKPFDPKFHEAVMTVESEEHEDGTVVAEFQKGYKLGDRVIRPSMVQVCKKG